MNNLSDFLGKHPVARSLSSGFSLALTGEHPHHDQSTEVLAYGQRGGDCGHLLRCQRRAGDGEMRDRRVHGGLQRHRDRYPDPGPDCRSDAARSAPRAAHRSRSQSTGCRALRRTTSSAPIRVCSTDRSTSQTSAAAAACRTAGRSPTPSRSRGGEIRPTAVPEPSRAGPSPSRAMWGSTWLLSCRPRASIR